MDSWHQWKAADRLLQEPDVTQAALREPHGQATRPQAAQADTVLLVQDTSELDFTAPRQTKDLGWIGNTGGRGMFLPSAMTAWNSVFCSGTFGERFCGRTAS
jgi:hypothetical protein